MRQKSTAALARGGLVSISTADAMNKQKKEK
jgi:hypothetical protein